MLSSSPLTNLKLFTYQGNKESVTLGLKTFAGAKALPINPTDRLCLNLEDPRTATVQQVAASPNAVGADWSEGEVVFVLPGTGLLNTPGSYYTSLLLVKGVEVLTLARGRIEVRYRPGYPHPG